MDKIILTWEDIENDCRTLAANLPSNIKMLLPVTRGGLIIAGILSQILDVRDIRTIGARSYSNENKQEEVDVFYRPNPTYFGVLPTECLIVDDILDSGKTLTKIVQNKWFFNQTPTSVLYDKDIGIFKATYVSRVVENKWIVFPWEI